MKKLLLIGCLFIMACQKQYNCKCFTETPRTRKELNASNIKATDYQSAKLECQKQNKWVNDSTDVECYIY